MTQLTWVTVDLGPTEMWVDGSTWRDYQAQGFELVDYKSPPREAIGWAPGRAKIRKPGSECKHTYSPELWALHSHVCRSNDNSYSGLLYGAVWKRLHVAHSMLFNEYRYHENIMHVDRDDTSVQLEDVQKLVVDAICAIAAEFGGDTRRRIQQWADSVSAFKYTQPDPELLEASLRPGLGTDGGDRCHA